MKAEPWSSGLALYASFPAEMGDGTGEGGVEHCDILMFPSCQMQGRTTTPGARPPDQDRGRV